MKFIEFIGLLLVVYLATQIFLPAAMPKVFEYNWFFKDLFRKKKLPVDEQVEKLSNQRNLLNNKIEETKAEVESEVERAKKAQEELDKLK